MATATYGVPRTGAVMQVNARSINLTEIARKIKALRALSKVSNYSTNRTIGEMLDRLNSDELVTVGELLMVDPEEAQEKR
jgi:hypothetical protein